MVGVLTSVFADSFGAADEEIEEGAEALEEDDDEEPDDLIVAFGRFLLGDFDDHHDPEDGGEDADDAGNGEAEAGDKTGGNESEHDSFSRNIRLGFGSGRSLTR